jgi:hypothetical protein
MVSGTDRRVTLTLMQSTSYWRSSDSTMRLRLAAVLHRTVAQWPSPATPAPARRGILLAQPTQKEHFARHVSDAERYPLAWTRKLPRPKIGCAVTTPQHLVIEVLGEDKADKKRAQATTLGLHIESLQYSFSYLLLSLAAFT